MNFFKKSLKKFKKIKKPFRIAILILLLIIILIPGASLSRYVYSLVYDHFFNTKNFYFKSDLLGENDPEYTITNWSGVDSYTLIINMNSISNDLKKSDSNIIYDIRYECGENVTCQISKTEGEIRIDNGSEDANNKDYFTLTLTPNIVFKNKEETRIRIQTKATSPYEKTLSATFVLRVEKVGLNYEITDKENSIYSTLRLTNSATYYKVVEAFGEYSVDDEIESAIYDQLSETDKAKCSSMMVTIAFDPSVLSLDMTNPYFLEAQEKGGTYIHTSKYHVVKENFGDYREGDIIPRNVYNQLSNSDKNKCSDRMDYIDQFTISLDILSSADIRFYKRDKSQNYTYPLVNTVSEITVT